MAVLQTPDYTDLYYWVTERERIRKLKDAGFKPNALTTDPILAEWRFCNVRREDDRVTVWVDRMVRRPFADHPLLWLMLCICRMVNWPDALEDLIESGGGWPSNKSFSPAKMQAVLDERQARGEKVYTGAYVVPAPPAGGPKNPYICDVVIGELHRKRHVFAQLLADWPTLQNMHTALKQMQGWGPFLSYQAVVDMRFTPLLRDAPDVETWACAGPGTLRGLNRVHGRPYEQDVARINSPAVQAKALAEILEIHRLVEWQTGVAVDLSDVPNILCELDKYLRVKRGEGFPRARYVPGRGY
jgi:hypothetical protein